MSVRFWTHLEMTPAVEFTTSRGTVYGPWGEASGEGQKLQVCKKPNVAYQNGLLISHVFVCNPTTEGPFKVGFRFFIPPGSCQRRNVLYNCDLYLVDYSCQLRIFYVILCMHEQSLSSDKFL